MDQVEIDGFQLEIAAVKLREIENVVNQGDERLRGIEHHVGVILLHRRQFCFAQHSRHPDHTIQRRADFMGHHGEKARFRLVGLHREGAVPDIDAVCRLARIDGIAARIDFVEDTVSLCFLFALRDPDPQAGPSLNLGGGANTKDELPVGRLVGLAAEMMEQQLAIVGMHATDQRHGVGDQGLRRPPQQRLGLGAEIGELEQSVGCAPKDAERTGYGVEIGAPVARSDARFRGVPFDAG